MVAIAMKKIMIYYSLTIASFIFYFIIIVF